MYNIIGFQYIYDAVTSFFNPASYYYAKAFSLRTVYGGC